VSAQIVRQGANLIVPIQSTLSDEDWLQLQASLSRQVREQRSTGVVIDVGTLDVLDSFAGRMLESIAQCMRLGGVRAVVTGISPEIAYAMVQLGLRLSGISTALDQDRALEMLRRHRDGLAI
jgi:rsbT antagonist protein RsbS